MITTINLDIKNIPLTEFMRAIGQENPVATDGNLRIYNAPYNDRREPTMIVNTETNTWRDTKTGSYGGIYDLAFEMTGCCNMSALNQYIASEMSAIRKIDIRHEPEPQRPQRKFRL